MVMYANEVKTKEKEKLTEIKNLRQHIHVSTPFILTICEKKYEIVSCIISVWSLKWKSYQTKNAPTDEIRLCTVQMRVRK